YALVGHLHAWAVHTGPVLGPALAAVIGAVIAARRAWARRCHRTLELGARVVTILPPPDVEPAGAAALWSNLVGLLRPAWARLLTGHPHRFWESVSDPAPVRLQIGVPAPVPPGMTERAAQAPCPGTHPHTPPAPPPLPATGAPAAGPAAVT